MKTYHKVIGGFYIGTAIIEKYTLDSVQTYGLQSKFPTDFTGQHYL